MTLTDKLAAALETLLNATSKRPTLLAQIRDAEPAAIEALRAYERDKDKPIDMIIVLEGGQVQYVATNSDQKINATIVDYDTDGVPDDELVEIPQDSGGTEDAIAFVTEVTHDPAGTNKMLEVLREQDNARLH